MIPEFTTEGQLPAGIHKVPWPEFRGRFGYTYHRMVLLQGMLSALKSLKKAGCSTVFIDGSFVTNKLQPNDYDGCWDAAGVDVNLLDPVFRNFGSKRTAQKVKFSGELFPANTISRFNNSMLDFFQKDRNGNSKGIVEINLGDIDD